MCRRAIFFGSCEQAHIQPVLENLGGRGIKDFEVGIQVVNRVLIGRSRMTRVGDVETAPDGRVFKEDSVSWFDFSGRLQCIIVGQVGELSAWVLPAEGLDDVIFKNERLIAV